MGSLFDLQRALYGGAVDALKVLHTEGMTQLPALVGSAFVFGMLHALLPGHGKAILAAFYANRGRWQGAIGSSAILIVTHVGVAVLIVLSGFAILERSLVGAGRAIAIERASQILIVLIGLWLLWRAFRPHAHHKERSGPLLAFFAGLVPCPLTAFIMTFAIGKGAVVAGLILSATFAAGMIVTVAAFPLAALLASRSVATLTSRTSALHSSLGSAITVGSALAIIALGLLPLIPS